MHTSKLHQPKRHRILADSTAKPLLEALREKTAKILGGVFGTNLVTLQNTAGNFPFYWQDPNKSLFFNSSTYEWVSQNILANSDPLAQDTGSQFIALYRRVIGNISYKLSLADQGALDLANQQAAIQQTSLLNGWQTVYGSQSLDDIMDTITTKWANPATDLTTILNTPDLSTLLNQTPASGMQILPLLADYLNAINSVVPLLNASSSNNGYLARLRNAIDNPTTDNGAMPINVGTTLKPAWKIDPLAQIIDGLQDANNAAQVTMDIERTSNKEVTVNISGQASFSIPVDDFFTADVNASASYFSDHIATSENKVSISMSFPGVTPVNFSPVIFDISSRTNWYWTTPITEAIQSTGNDDVSAYKFSSDPKTDFTTNGPFGFLQGLAISDFPTIVITVHSEDYDSIATTFDQSVEVDVSVMGIHMGSGSESSHTASTTVDSSSSTVTITLTPPPPVTGENVIDLEAWVLGAVPTFPGA